MLTWATGDAGQAVATWMSALLSLLAIVVALKVALVEQRRANEEKIRELMKEREAQERQFAIEQLRKSRFIHNCLAILDIAQVSLSDIRQSIPQGSFIDWEIGFEIPRSMGPPIGSLKALQTVWHEDPEVALLLRA